MSVSYVHMGFRTPFLAEVWDDVMAALSPSWKKGVVVVGILEDDDGETKFLSIGDGGELETWEHCTLLEELHT